jgi:hypothetical protein
MGKSEDGKTQDGRLEIRQGSTTKGTKRAKLGRWKMEDGRWKMEDGRWKMEDGRWKARR